MRVWGSIFPLWLEVDGYEVMLPCPYLLDPLSQGRPVLFGYLEVSPQASHSALSHAVVGAHGLDEAVGEVGLSGWPAFDGTAPEVHEGGR